MKIYVDMDGVLCDFLEGASWVVGRNIVSHRAWSRKRYQYWMTIKAKGVSFWTDLNWMPAGKELWETLVPYNPTILSAYPKMRELRQDAIRGKRKWIVNNIGYGVMKEAIICDVISEQRYSAPGRVLIDDNKQTIRQWEKHGGIGILHTSTENTLKELKKHACIRI